MDVYGATSYPELHPRTHGEKPRAGWDYAFVFDARPTSTDPLSPSDIFRNRILATLINIGFAYHQRWVPADGIVIVRFALPESVMMTMAQLQLLQLKTQPRFGGGFMPFSVDKSNVFINQDRDDRGQPYFPASDRVLITLAVLKSRENWGASLDVRSLIYTGHIKQAFAIHAEPDRSTLFRAIVLDEWWNPIRRIPLFALKEYIGTHVALYVAWLSFYTRILFALALFSVPTYYILTNYEDSERLTSTVRVVFALVLCFWSFYGQEQWNRRNAVLNVQWGMSHFHEDSENNVRPDFKGTLRRGFYCPGGFVDLNDLDPVEESTELQRRVSHTDSLAIVTGDDRAHNVLVLGGRRDQDFVVEAALTGITFPDLPSFPYFDPWHRLTRTRITTLITVFFSILVAIASILVLLYQANLVQFLGAHRIGRYVPGITLGFLIIFVDTKWQGISERLTLWENHRTDHAFERSLIRKRFAFQFVSNYLSLFYISFVKPFTPSDPCHLGWNSGVPDCMVELESVLTSFVITKSTVQQVIELGIPSLSYRFKKWKAQLQGISGSNSELQHIVQGDEEIDDNGEDRVLEESKMAPYDSTLSDYEEVVVQHGTLALFGLAFPLAAFINFLNNVVECRTDTYKMLIVSKRTDSMNAADIGGWQEVLDFLTTLSIITNAGLLTITSVSLQKSLPNFIGDRAENYRVLSFLVFEHILLAIRWGVAASVSSKPSSTYRVLARQEFLIAKMFNTGWKTYFRGDESKAKEEEEVV